jgi:hypothetical protein
MAASPKADQPISDDPQRGLKTLLATEREMLAKRIADAPTAWISIPMWGRVFRAWRRLIELPRRGGAHR